MDNNPKKLNDIDENLDNFFDVDDKEIDDIIKQAEADLKSEEAQKSIKPVEEKKKTKKPNHQAKVFTFKYLLFDLVRLWTWWQVLLWWRPNVKYDGKEAKKKGNSKGTKSIFGKIASAALGAAITSVTASIGTSVANATTGKKSTKKTTTKDIANKAIKSATTQDILYIIYLTQSGIDGFSYI